MGSNNFWSVPNFDWISDALFSKKGKRDFNKSW